MSFAPEFLHRRLLELEAGGPPASRLLVGFSGGIDSAVLLHALARTSVAQPIVAVHVDHGLHDESARWAERAVAFARSLDIDCLTLCATVEEAGSGPEAAARHARYAAFESLVQEGDWLLSAHHAEDQAETLLLNLLRGSGVLGLAGIASKRPLGSGWLVRPMLDVSRASIEAYARRAGLDWVEDPSNRDNRFDRNFLRNEVLPRLRKRWPAAGKMLKRSAELAAEASGLLDELAARDLGAAGRAGRLQIAALQSLSPARQRNLLRFAVRTLGLPAPPAKRLRQITGELLTARADAQPLVTWPGAEVRRYRQCVYLLPESKQPALVTARLAPDKDLSLGVGMGRLRLARCDGRGIRAPIAEQGLDVSFRQGGERLRPAEGARTRALKTLMQEAGIVPWMRSRIPLLTSAGRLVAVADLWIDESFAGGGGYVVRWDERPAID